MPAAAEELRAGSRVLSLFVSPFTARVLRAHEGGPRRLGEVCTAIGFASESTVRVAISGLCEVGALLKRPAVESSQGVVTEVTEMGEEMLFAAGVLEDWLARCPEGPIPPDSEAAKTAVKSLAGGWNSTLMHALAGSPLTLTELSARVPGITYPTLERRLSWLKMTGQIEALEKESRGTPYVVTDWLRHSIAPICAAGRCERRHLPGTTRPLTDVEVETTFLLTMPLAPFPADADGAITLAVQTSRPEDPDRKFAGVTIELEEGSLSACRPGVEPAAPTSLVADPDRWLEFVVDGDVDTLDIAGADPSLAAAVITALHRYLFAPAGEQANLHTDL